MKLAFICDNEQESAALMEFYRQRQAGGGASPAGGPPPGNGAPPAGGPPGGAPPAGGPPPNMTAASPPPPPPPPSTPAPGGAIGVPHVLAAMQAYRTKVGDAAIPYIQQLFQQLGIQQPAQANQAQLDWLYNTISKL
jgi:hypothetical protein